MSNFWRLQPFLRPSTQVLAKWPSVATMELVLEPDDYFGIDNTKLPKTSIASTAKFGFDQTRFALFIENAVLPQKLSYKTGDHQSSLSFEGNILTFRVEIESLEHLTWNVHWITHDFMQSLSIQTGIFIEYSSIAVKVGDQQLAQDNKIEGLSLTIGIGEDNIRRKAIDTATDLPPANNPSYRRFEIGSRYFYHVLRLTSPRQVNFSPIAVYSEVMLNLVKCLEIVFGTSKRDDFRVYFKKLCLTESQIETQLIPIILIRNEMDVGHPSTGFAKPEEVCTLRAFVGRSIGNVRTVLQLTLAQLTTDPDFLDPVPQNGQADRVKFVSMAEECLKNPALENLSSCASIGLEGTTSTPNKTT